MWASSRAIPALVLATALAVSAGCARTRESGIGDDDAMARLHADRDRAFADIEGGATDEGMAADRGVARPDREPTVSRPVEAPVKPRSRPGWVRSGLSANYPQAEYVVGIGSCRRTGAGDHAAMATAADRARSAVAKSIRVRVRSEFRSAAELVTAVASGETVIEKNAMAVMDKITSQADLVLEGAEIADRWYDADAATYWAFAALHRATVAGTLLDRLDTLRQQMKQEHELGSDLRVQGRVFQSLRHLNSALEKSFGILNYRAQLRAISPSHAPSPDPELTELWRDAAETRESLRLGVILFVEADGKAGTSARAEAEISRTLRAMGLNTVKLAPVPADASYGDLKSSLARLREIVGGAVNCIVLARISAEKVGAQKLVKLLIHFYQARGELVVVDLDEDGEVAAAGFDLSPRTHAGNKEPAAAAESALVKASQELAAQLKQELSRSLNLTE